MSNHAHQRPQAPWPTTLQGPENQKHYAQKRLKAMTQMGESLGLDPERLLALGGEQELWRAISEQVAGGIGHTSETVIGDPFVVSVTARCECGREHVAIVKTGKMVDQAEGEKITRFLRRQDSMIHCVDCGAELKIFSTAHSRLSVLKSRMGPLEGK